MGYQQATQALAPAQRGASDERARDAVLSAVGRGPGRLTADGRLVMDGAFEGLPEGTRVEGTAPVVAEDSAGGSTRGLVRTRLSGGRFEAEGVAPLPSGQLAARAGTTTDTRRAPDPQGEVEATMDRAHLHGLLRLVAGRHGVRALQAEAHGETAGEATVRAGVELELEAGQLEAIATHFELSGPEEAHRILLGYKRAWTDHGVEDEFEAEIVAELGTVSLELSASLSRSGGDHPETSGAVEGTIAVDAGRGRRVELFGRYAASPDGASGGGGVRVRSGRDVTVDLSVSAAPAGSDGRTDVRGVVSVTIQTN